MKKNIFTLLLGVTIVSIFTACNSDFRRRAGGSIEEIIVVMDSSMWNSETAKAIRETYGRNIMTLPNPVPFYQLSFTDFYTNKQLENLKSLRNVIIAAPIDEQSNTGELVRSSLPQENEDKVRSGESFAFPVKDQWYKDQYVIILTSTSDDELASKIRNSERSIISDVFERELLRWEEDVYDRLEQTQYSDSLWDAYGWKVRIQHDYIKNIDTLNFVTFRRSLIDNDRWMWAWWQDDVDNISFLDNNWINAKRDSLLETWIRGTREDSYTTTDYKHHPVETQTFNLDNLFVHETQGVWTMTNDAMAGPFVNFTYYDPDTRRLFMVEYGQFAPVVRNKRRYVKQFRAMGRTFESDSLYNQRKANKEAISSL